MVVGLVNVRVGKAFTAVKPKVGGFVGMCMLVLGTRTRGPAKACRQKNVSEKNKNPGRNKSMISDHAAFRGKCQKRRRPVDLKERKQQSAASESGVIKRIFESKTA